VRDGLVDHWGEYPLWMSMVGRLEGQVNGDSKLVTELLY
jgi:hypothetical protein